MSKFQIFLIVLYLFFFGAVGGWVLELLFRRFFSGANPERKWLNPGFLFGPCLPLYGFGTVLLFILSELDHQLFGSFSGTFWYYPVMFVVMALAMTLLEYIVGVLSFKGFHLRLWDYKNVYDAIDVQKLWHKMQSRGGFFRLVSIRPLTERIDAFDEFLHRRPGSMGKEK